MKKYVLKVIVIFSLTMPLFSAPSPPINVLLIKLENTPSIEEKININFELAALLFSHNTEQTIKYIQAALSLAKENKSYENIALAHYRLYQILSINEATLLEGEKNIHKALSLCNKHKFEELQSTILKTLSNHYTLKGDYNAAIIYALELAKNLKIEDSSFATRHLEIARLYSINQDYNNSNYYLYPLLWFLEQQKDYVNLYNGYKRLTNNLVLQNNNELAKEAMLKAHKYAYLSENTQLISEGYYFLGTLFEKKGEEKDTAIHYYQEAIALARNVPNPKVLIRLLCFIGLDYCLDNMGIPLIKPIYDELNSIQPFPQEFARQFLLIDIYVSKNMHQYDELFEKTNEYLQQANISSSTLSFLNTQILQYYITERIRQVDASYTPYFEAYTKIKTNFIELMQNHFFALEEEYKKGQRDIKTNYQKLELENTNLQRYIIIFTCVFISLLALFFVIHISLKKKHDALNQKNNLLKLQKEINALELSMLNNQLDPNEIKNLIDSIAPEVQQYVPEAYEQISQLFNITRASLSNKMSESLAIQLAQVEDFIKLNIKTISYPLSYEIVNTNIVNKAVELPRLLLKNIVENALKHGIKPKKAAGHILINLEEKNNTVFIKVIDNGVSNTLDLSEKSDSTGIGFTAYKKLFQLLNKQNKNKADLNIQFSPTGTTVNISIPINYTYSIQNLSL